MSKPINQDIKNILLNYMQQEWIKNGQKEFSKSMADIVKDLDGILPAKNKNTLYNNIFHYIKILENNGSIKVARGEGAKPNVYTYLGNDISNKVNEVKEEAVGMIEEAVERAMNALQELVNINVYLTKKHSDTVGELEYLKHTFGNLKYFATDNNGKEIYEVNGSIKSVIDKIIKEQQISQ